MPGIVEVDGFDLDVQKEGVLVEQNRASSVVDHVVTAREELVVNVFNRLLQRDDMPFSCNLFLNSALSSTSRSGFELLMLNRFCTDERLGTLLSK